MTDARLPAGKHALAGYLRERSVPEHIPYTRPSVTALESGLVTDAAVNGWGERCYDYIHRFEAAFRDYLGCRFAIATSSCTGAMHLGLAALGVGPGDEVILADSNWIASVAPVVHLGARPVFVDIQSDRWCLDPDKVERAITRRTKAIIAVHLYGNVCEMDRLLAIGARHGVAVVEDAAEAIGSGWQGQAAGTMGAFGTFSFHGTKTVSTGEGGMFVTNDAALHEMVLTLSNHGRSRTQPRQFWPDVVGFKYKMSNLQAAMGCGQMQRIDELVARKRGIFDYYARRLRGLAGLALNPEHAGTVNGYWMPTVVFDTASGVTREDLCAAFARDNIDARVFFHPLSGLPMFEARPDNTNAWGIPTRAINLPSFHDMTPAQQDRVVDVIHRVWGAHGHQAGL
jgi:perosamine synthetase